MSSCRVKDCLYIMHCKCFAVAPYPVLSSGSLNTIELTPNNPASICFPLYCFLPLSNFPSLQWERAWILERIMLVKNPNSHIVDSLHTSSCFLRILNSKLEMADLQNTLKWGQVTLRSKGQCLKQGSPTSRLRPTNRPWAVQNRATEVTGESTRSPTCTSSVCVSTPFARKWSCVHTRTCLPLVRKHPLFPPSRPPGRKARKVGELWLKGPILLCETFSALTLTPKRTEPSECCVS